VHNDQQNSKIFLLISGSIWNRPKQQHGSDHQN